MNTHRRGAALLALLMVALVATGCGGSSDNGGGASAASLKALDINAHPRDQIKDGGTIRWAIDQLSTQWNYNQVNGPESSTFDVITGMLPGAFIADEKGDVFPDPNYVASAKITATKPHQVVTYELNPKGRWSDGKPITWLDFQAQWKALHSASGPYQIASSTGYERITTVKQGKNPYEVLVTYGRPFGEWQSLFAPLYPAATNNDPKSFDKSYFNKIPVTAGPFKMGKIDQTAKTVTIVRDPKWWGPPAKLDKIVFRALEIDAGINAFANGEVDFVRVGGDPSAVKRLSGVKGGKVNEAAGPDFRHFTINGTGPLLSDINVRRAVAMAIDRSAITRADLTGLHWPVRTMDNHFLVNTQIGYEANAGTVGKFDAAAARKLLDDAGWKLSGTYRKKGGKTLELRFVIPSGIATSRQEGELTQAMLRDVGVKLDIRTVPSDDFFDKYIQPGNYDLVPFSWLGTPFPVSSAKSIYVEPTKDKKGELQIQQNFARVGSPAIDKLMNRAQEVLDPGRARELVNEADKLVWSEVHSLILYQRPQITASTATLANIGSWGFKSPLFQDIGFVK
jgi:peptide/nickel transport system substrate-binding protein